MYHKSISTQLSIIGHFQIPTVNDAHRGELEESARSGTLNYGWCVLVLSAFNL